MVRIQGRIPERGDLIRLQLDPRTRSEQAGYRPAFIVSPSAYNQVSKLILICPITSRQKGWPFEVELSEQLQTFGVILADQIRTVDCNAKNASFIEHAPLELIDEVLAKIGPLVA